MDEKQIRKIQTEVILFLLDKNPKKNRQSKYTEI